MPTSRTQPYVRAPRSGSPGGDREVGRVALSADDDLGQTTTGGTFGDLLRAARQQRQLTQEELSEASGVSVRAISDMERGRARSPQRRTVEALVQALRLPEEPLTQLMRAARSGRLRAAGASTDTRSDHVPTGLTMSRKPVVPAQLPPDVADFTGREHEVKYLCDVLSGIGGPLGEVPIVIAVVGPGGIGKSTLAVQVAHQVRDGFDDGQLCVNLGAATGRPLGPADVLARFLRALDVEEPFPLELDERAALYRSVVANRRMLILLDDARDAAQVRPLLPGASACVVIVTSRFHLADLAGSRQLPVGVLAEEEGLALFSRLVGAQRVEPERTAADEVVTACGGLPLAIRIAAARLVTRPQWTIQSIADRLADEQSRLTELRSGDFAIRASFAASYDGLSGLATSTGCVDPTRAFRLLGIVDAPDMSLGAAAALLDTTFEQAAEMLELLVDAHLLESPSANRYRFHDLIRMYARERAQRDESAVDRDAALRRLFSWYARTAAMVNRVLEARQPNIAVGAGESVFFAALPDAREWLEAERANLVAAIGQAGRMGQHDAVVLLCRALGNYLQAHSHPSEWTRGSLAELLAVAGEAVPELRAAALKVAGSRAFAPDLTRAAALTEQSLALFRRQGDPRGTAEALYQRGVIAFYQADYAQATTYLEETLALARRLGDVELVSRSLLSLAGPNSARADLKTTESWAANILLLYQRNGNTSGIVTALEVLLYVARIDGDRDRMRLLLDETLDVLRHDDPPPDPQLRERLARMAFEMTTVGEYRQAMSLLDEGIALSLRKGHCDDAAHLSASLAQCAREQGQHNRATSLLQESLAVFRRLEDMRGIAISLIGLADVARDQGDSARGLAFSQEGLAIARDFGDTLLAGYALHNQGVATWQQGGYTEAEVLFKSALASLEQIVEGRAEVLATVGLMTLEQGGLSHARQAFAESLRTRRAGGLPWLIATDLEGMAGVAGQDGRWQQAARLFGAAQSIRIASGTPIQPTHQTLCERRIVATSEVLGVERFNVDFAQGQAMTSEQAIAYALDDPALCDLPATEQQWWRGFR